MGTTTKSQQRHPRRRQPKPVTEQRLHNAALYYLERYASSSGNLRRVLMRRVERSARLHDTDREDGARMVEALLRRFQDSGLLNDGQYAEARAASLFRQGCSLRAIRGRLYEKGVAEADIEQALTALGEEQGAEGQDLDRAAALTCARRRRLGPFRGGNREAFHDKDMAALARRGFGLDTVRWIMAADSPEALEEDME